MRQVNHSDGIAIRSRVRLLWLSTDFHAVPERCKRRRRCRHHQLIIPTQIHMRLNSVANSVEVSASSVHEVNRLGQETPLH